jgi:hypothetical protein
MLRALKQLNLWWLRYGEGPSFSRTVTLVGSLVTIGAVYFHEAAMATTAQTADLVSLIFAWVFGSVTVIVLLRSFLLLKFWPWRKFHPGAPIASEHLTDLPPEPGRDSPYQFHLAGSTAELKPYVSESEYFLSESNPDLDRAARQALYEGWLRLNARSFLYLTRADRTSPVALSIVLPLTKKGYESLYGISRPKKKVVDFGIDEIAKRGPYRYLLVDTFVISQRRERGTPNKLKGHRRYGRTLLFRHLALFWRDASMKTGPTLTLLGQPNPRPIVLIAETEKPQLIKDLDAIGFERKGTSAIDCPLYEFEYPVLVTEPGKKNLVKALIERIWEVRNWKIQMNVRIDD